MDSPLAKRRKVDSPLAEAVNSPVPADSGSTSSLYSDSISSAGKLGLGTSTEEAKKHKLVYI